MDDKWPQRDENNPEETQNDINNIKIVHRDDK